MWRTALLSTDPGEVDAIDSLVPQSAPMTVRGLQGKSIKVAVDQRQQDLLLVLGQLPAADSRRVLSHELERDPVGVGDGVPGHSEVVVVGVFERPDLRNLTSDKIRWCDGVETA